MSLMQTIALRSDSTKVECTRLRAEIASDSWVIRVIAGLYGRSSTANGRRHLLVAAFSFFLVFQVGSLFKAQWLFEAELHHYSTAVPAYLDYAELILTALALLLTLAVLTEKRWQVWVLSYWGGIIAIRLLMCIVVDQDEPLVVALMAVVLTTGLLMPWSAAWQSAIAGMTLVAFTIASFVGVIDLNDIERWLILLATAAFGLSFSVLKDNFARQRSLIEALGYSEKELRRENAERREIEERLREEVVEREAAERTAREDQAALRGVFDSSLDAITVQELSTGRLTYMNKEFAGFGYDRSAAIGKSFQELGLFAKRSDYLMIGERLRIRGRLRNFEVSVRAADGTFVPSLLSASVVDLNGKRCAVSTIRDIAARKQMEEELIAARESALAASRAKSEFLSSMSHEIRTPLNAVLGMGELLAETELSIEQRRYLDIMIANGNSLLELINSVLDLARIESGRMQIEKTEFDLGDLIDQAISTFGVRAHGKGLELMARLGPGVAQHLVGDPMRLRQVLVNLLGNAIKFTEMGQVVLDVNTMSPESDVLCFSVADTGIGIKSDKLASIFQSFTQEDSSTTRRFGGSGLGLAIAQRLVTLMGGRIWVESEEGKGSKFSFTCKFGLASRVISAAADIVLSLESYRVLVVDDNQINRMIVREMVASCGAKVIEAESGPQALDAIRNASLERNPFHIVLLDMRMPEMDGLEVARRIHEEHLPSEPLILMLSSDDLKPQLSRLRDLGLDAYLINPSRAKNCLTQ